MGKIVGKREKRFNFWITVISIIVPIVVAVLFGVRLPNVERLGFLPPIYAGINALTAVLLVLAVMAIKNGNRGLHQRLMGVNIGLSVMFLIMYIAYHMTSDPTVFGGSGWVKFLYYGVLISHIVLSVIIVPLVLRTFAKAYLGDFAGHRKLARITFPLWLYVAVSGVVVYLMISPYYPV